MEQNEFLSRLKSVGGTSEKAVPDELRKELQKSWSREHYNLEWKDVSSFSGDDLIRLLKGIALCLDGSPAGMFAGVLLDKLKSRMPAEGFKALLVWLLEHRIDGYIPYGHYVPLGTENEDSVVMNRTPGISVPLGNQQNGEKVILELNETPHLFIVGKKEINKRDFFRNIITQIMDHNDPKGLGFAYIGSSWKELKDSPFLITQPGGSDHQDTWNAIDFVRKEFERRLATKSSRTDVKWRTIVLFCEEFEQLHNSWFDAKDVVARIVHEGESVGMHVIFMTSNQQGNSEGCRGRLVFAVDGPKVSQLLLGIPDASKLAADNKAYFVRNISAEPLLVTVNS